MFRIAIQEDMLPGRSVRERLENAHRLGLDGVEFWAEGLTPRVPEIAQALADTGLAAAAVNLGRSDGYLSPLLAEREAAIGRMRQAMADAVDLAAEHVIFVPLWGPPRMPDLTPYRAPVELEGEMMVWLLRTVSDLAYALGVNLHMQPVNRYESYFMNRLEQAAAFRTKIKKHPHILVAPNLFHMALEEDDLLAALRSHHKHTGYLHLADHNRRLPGQGLIDFRALLSLLRELAYTGWLTLECGRPGHNAASALACYRDLPAALALLRGTD